jgi:hypothetical protein
MPIVFGLISSIKLGVGTHMHLAQKGKEVNYVKTTYGKGAVEYLNDIGLLDGRIVVFQFTCLFNAFSSNSIHLFFESNEHANNHPKN